MHFGRIKNYLFFFLKSLLNIQMFQSLLHLCRLSFSNCVSCRRHYEEVKNTSNALGSSAVTLKMGIGIKRPFLPWKFIAKIVVFKRKKAFCTKKNLSLGEIIDNFENKVWISHFKTVLGKLSCGIKVSYRWYLIIHFSLFKPTF